MSAEGRLSVSVSKLRNPGDSRQKSCIGEVGECKEQTQREALQKQAGHWSRPLSRDGGASWSLDSVAKTEQAGSLTQPVLPVWATGWVRSRAWTSYRRAQDGALGRGRELVPHSAEWRAMTGQTPFPNSVLPGPKFKYWKTHIRSMLWQGY